MLPGGRDCESVGSGKLIAGEMSIRTEHLGVRSYQIVTRKFTLPCGHDEKFNFAIADEAIAAMPGNWTAMKAMLLFMIEDEFSRAAATHQCLQCNPPMTSSALSESQNRSDLASSRIADLTSPAAGIPFTEP